MQLRFFPTLGSRRIGGFLVIPKGLFGNGLSGFLRAVSPVGIPNCGRTIKSRESGSHGI